LPWLKQAKEIIAGKKMCQNEDIQNSLRLSRIVPVVYDELRKQARRYMAREKAGQTLQATALVNEVYLRLIKEKTHAWQNRAHFCAIAAGAMREILVDRARARAAAKRGGSRIRVSFDGLSPAKESASIDFLALHEALKRLSDLDPHLARIVELRFFGGLSVEEAAEFLDSSPATIKRSWSLAKSWLKRELEKTCEP
jgi:RNA polymerase sigma-70 factor, ECF subfamily